MSLKATEVAEKPKKPKPKESSSIQLLRFNTKEEIYFKPKTAIRNSKTQGMSLALVKYEPKALDTVQDSC